MAYKDYEEFAAAHRRQCYEQRQRREAEETERREIAPLVFKTNEDARVASESPKQPVVTPPVVAPDEKQVWWQWTDERIAHALEAHRFNDTQRRVLAQVIAEIRHEWRDGDSAVKREFEQQRRELTVSLREQVIENDRALREEVRVAREQQEEKDALARYEIGVVRRELATLREEVALERGFQALKAEIAVAKSEIPRLPEIEARVDAKLSQMAVEQSRLHTKLEKTRDRISRMRVDQSVTDYSVKKLEEAQRPVVELKFESVDGQFTMRDMHPDAAAAWRRFVREMVEANEGTMFPNDPTGRVVALPRKNGNAA
jgi:hypothetical protein